MRILTTLGTAACAVLLANTGCGTKHIEDCDGGLLVSVTAPSATLSDGNTLWVQVTVDRGLPGGGGGSQDHSWPVSRLGPDGTGTLLLNFGLLESATISAVAEVRDSSNNVLATAVGAITMAPATTGCSALDLMLTADGVDGGAGTPDGGVDAATTDAPFGTPDANVDGSPPPIDGSPPIDAPPGTPDANVDAFVPPDDASVPMDGPVIINMDGGTGGDMDFDGYPDTTDNCPGDWQANQYDDDLDGVGDVCDNCPGTHNTSQGDLDFDDVGDLCDPHPNPASPDWDWIDTIVRFEPFLDNTVFSDPTLQSNGTWVVTNSELRSTNATSDSAFIIDNFGTATGSVVVRTSMRATSTMGGPGSNVTFTNGADALGPGGGGFFCSMIPEPPGSEKLDLIQNWTMMLMGTNSASVFPNQWYDGVLRAAYEDVGGTTDVSCNVGTGFVNGTDTANFTGDYVGFHTRTTTASFRFITVIESEFIGVP